MNVNKPLVN